MSAVRGRRTTWWRGRRPAQAVVELAIALTVVLLLVLGIFDFAPAIVRAAQLTQAVREGAAYGRSAPTQTAAIKTRVKQSITSLDLADGDITVTCQTGLDGADKACASATIGDSISVAATFTYVPTSGYVQAFAGATLPISRTARSEIF